MKPGTYIAKVSSYSIPARDPGKEQVSLIFQTANGDSIEWRGSLSSEKAIAYTLSALITAGFKHNDLWKLLEVGAFDDRDVEIVVEDQEYNGKIYPRVKWINIPNRSEDPFAAQQKFSKFSSTMAALRAGKAAPSAPTSDSDVPF